MLFRSAHGGAAPGPGAGLLGPLGGVAAAARPRDPSMDPGARLDIALAGAVAWPDDPANADPLDLDSHHFAMPQQRAAPHMMTPPTSPAIGALDLPDLDADLFDDSEDDLQDDLGPEPMDHVAEASGLVDDDPDGADSAGEDESNGGHDQLPASAAIPSMPTRRLHPNVERIPIEETASLDRSIVKTIAAAIQKRGYLVPDARSLPRTTLPARDYLTALSLNPADLKLLTEVTPINGEILDAGIMTVLAIFPGRRHDVTVLQASLLPFWMEQHNIQRTFKTLRRTMFWERRVMIIPIFKGERGQPGGHWQLAVVYLHARRIEIFDSLRLSSERTATEICSMIDTMMSHPDSFTESRVDVDMQVPWQLAHTHVRTHDGIILRLTTSCR